MKISVIGTGGTIAGASRTRMSFQEYRSAHLKIAQMITYLQPEVGKLADVEAIQFANKEASSFSLPEFHDLSLLIDRQLRTSDGVVVTAGTDTIEELAYWLDLTLRSPKPVVLTGAMRPWTVIGSDGPSNLYNAIRLAASRRTSYFGPVIMLNDEILPAREATKTNISRLGAMRTREVGVLGYIDDLQIRVLRAPPRILAYLGDVRFQTPFNLATIDRDQLPRVEIVYSYQAAGGEAISAFAEAGAAGIVVAGTGPGGVSPAQMDALRSALSKGVVFVLTARAGAGAVYHQTEDILAGEDLLPQKARLLLLLALACSRDAGQIRRWIREYGIPEFSLPGEDVAPQRLRECHPKVLSQSSE